MIRQAVVIIGMALVVCLAVKGLAWLLWPAVPVLIGLLVFLLFVGVITNKRS